MLAPIGAGLAMAGATLLLLRPRRSAPAPVRALRPAEATRGSPRRPMPVAAVLPLRVWRARRDQRDQQAAVRDALPDIADLLRLATSAGLTARLSVEVVADLASGPLAVALDQARRHARVGEPLADGLDALLALGDAVRPLHQALVSAARDGTPLGTPLERVAHEARLVRRRQAEERARRLPVQLLFPLVLCILPAFGLLAVVPLLAGSIGVLPW